jgi:hypothetical protein
MPASTRAVTGVGCAAAGPRTAAPEVGLQLIYSLVDPRSLRVIRIGVEQDALIGIVAQKFPHPCSVSRRQKVGAQVLGPDRVGFRFLEVLALIAAVGGH